MTMVCSDRAGAPPGPPSVHRSPKRASASIVPVMIRKMKVGRRLGSVMCHQIWSLLAPSMAAASYMSVGIVCSPARTTRMK